MAVPGSFFLVISILVILPHVEVAKRGGRDLIQDISDAKEFKKLLRTHTNVLCLFTQSDRDASKQIKLFELVAEEVKGIATLAYINCGDDKKLCKKVKVNPKPLELKHYKDGEFNKDYDRKDTVKSMVNFLRDPMGEIPWEEDATADDVLHLENKAALSKVLAKEKRPLLIMFYAPWCGFCKRLKPDYAAAATDLKGHSVLAGMDVDRPENMQIRSDYNITGFPTIYYFEKGVLKYKYGGENNKDGIVTWMKNPAPPKEPEKEAEWADEESDVVHLTDDTFDEYLKNNPSVLIMFYAPWCGHCKKMKPEYTTAAAAMKEKGIEGTLAAVDATKYKSLGERYEVKGFPTVKYFKDGEVAFDFNERTADKIESFMADPKEPPPPPPPEPAWSETESDVIHLTEENFKPILKKKKHVLVMFYAPWCGHCKKAKPEYMQAAAAFQGDNKVAFCAIDCTQWQSVCSAHEVSGYPTFKYFNYGKNAQKYTGGREEPDFIAFMRDPLNPLAAAPPPAPSPDTLWEDVTGANYLHHLNEANFESFIKQHPSVLVMFYAPWCGHCKNMKPAYGEAAMVLHTEKVEGILATVDATAERGLGERFNVKGYPTIQYFRNGEFNSEYSRGRAASDFISFMKDPLAPAPAPPAVERWADTPSAVQHLTGDTFSEALAGRDALVMFYAPWCGHCKKAKPEYMQAAEALKDDASKAFAAVDCTTEPSLCQTNEVSGYPTIKYFSNGKFVDKYTSGRTKDEFLKFINNPPSSKDEL